MNSLHQDPPLFRDRLPRRPLRAEEVRRGGREGCPVCGARLHLRELPTRKHGGLLQASCYECGSMGQTRLT